MTTNIRSWGNSQGLYIPKKLLKEAMLEVNDSVVLTVENGAIVIRRDSTKDSRRKALASLKELREAHNNSRNLIADDYRKERDEYLDEKYDR